MDSQSSIDAYRMPDAIRKKSIRFCLITYLSAWRQTTERFTIRRGRNFL
jgi:hypothetical protein